MNQFPAVEYRAMVATTNKYNPTYLRRVAERHDAQYPVPVYLANQRAGTMTAAWFHSSYIIGSFVIDDPAILEKPLYPSVTLSAVTGITRIDLLLTSLDDRGVMALQKVSQ